MDAERFSVPGKKSTPAKTLPARQALLAALVVLSAAGCRSGPGRIEPSPLSFKEQEQRVLQLAPAGTPREEAVRKLSEAGIEGSFGVSPSIYYCDIWNRRDGRRRLLDVALLFNESGELYEVRPATAATGVLSAAEKGAETGSSATPRNETPANHQSEPAGASSGERSPPRQGRRTPFGETSLNR